jgi:sec-independent protein translocase protein TatA
VQVRADARHRGGEGKITVHPVLAEIFGPDLIIVIIVVAVVLFGGTQIPKLARSLGSAQSEFKKGLAEGSKGTDEAGTAAADTKDGAKE